MNKVFLIGNLTRDPELSETNSGVSMCRFAIAVNRPYTNGNGERETDFFNCVAWRGQADTVAKYCKKGKKVAISGSVQIRNYEGNDGVKRTAVDIVVQDLELLSPRENNGDDFYDAPAEKAAPAKKKPALQSFDDDGDIPF